MPEPRVTADAIDAARPPDPHKVAVDPGGTIMLLSPAETAAIKRQRDAMVRGFGPLASTIDALVK